ncbi:MAG: HAD-IC family P-type ATPase [Oscillospiraceae bacterium]|jgi:cation-transporting ATPase E|nr:HAD-IC family P-type ATPase [Oscillospiraceae bacterium]
MNHYSIPTKSVTEIIRTNTLTFFNLLNICLAAAVFLTGEYQNMLFMGVVVSNTLIGIIQELRAKRVTDRLSLIHQTKVSVIRAGVTAELNISEISPSDIIILGEGMQIPADCEVMGGNIEVNESLLTGESEPVGKKAGDSLLAGSFVICGEARAVVRKIGADSFAFSIIKGAKYLKKPASEMCGAVNKIIKRLAAVIVPVGLILLAKSVLIAEEALPAAVNSSVAAVIGMIPQGLILLTSVVMAVSVIRLSRHKALARDMYCAETLARVDVLCLDKTGTITTGEMAVEKLIPLADVRLSDIECALCALMRALPDRNPTALAIRAAYNKDVGWEATETFPFSSARKWSGANFKEHGSYKLGAASDAVGGKRTLVLSKHGQPVANLVISDKIRPEARETLAFFNRQGVEIKIISGDHPLTVKSAASAAGVLNADKFIDMSGVYGSEADIEKIAEAYTVFGRVTPQMKLNLIKALKKNHTVGMVGDGVNDVLPLKEADFSASMQSGSEAARNVSSLVLLDNNFASLPKAVAEGRRSINNLERSAALFLTRTVYSLILAVIFLFVAAPYPFMPIQMTLVNGVFIGIPSLILALEKNEELVRGKFAGNVLIKAVPYGLCAVLGIALLAVFAAFFKFTHEETRTAATIILGIASFAVLCRICRPINKKRLAIIAASGLLFSLGIEYFEELLSITVFTPQMHIVTFFLCAFMLPACIILPRLAEYIVSRKKKE